MSQPAHPIAFGYRSRDYALALGMSSGLRPLPACGGHLLVREIATSGGRDACGAYPVFCCREPAWLGEDIAALGDDLVSVTLVADPLLPWDPARLEQCFAVVRPLGGHFVIDLNAATYQPSSHHRRALRKAANHNTEIRVDTSPS
jgi:hypothetical protein